MTFVIQELLDHPQAIPTVVSWIAIEWPKESGSSLNKIEMRLVGNRIKNQLPLALIALMDNVPIGYVSLIHFELPDQKKQKFWVDGLYIEPSHRNRGFATQLLQAAIQKGRQLGLDHLSAYTSQVSLYSKLGWQLLDPTTQSSSESRVMRLDLRD